MFHEKHLLIQDHPAFTVPGLALSQSVSLELLPSVNPTYYPRKKSPFSIPDEQVAAFLADV